MRILLVEDDTILADGMETALRQSGYAVDWLDNGIKALEALSANSYAAAVLDLGLPGLDGLDVVKHAREQGNQTPILILTARDSLSDRVSGLNMGADDYLTKPFALPELEARLRALIRRNAPDRNTELTYGCIRLDTVLRRVFVDATPIELSARELSLLEFLFAHVEHVISKDQLFDHLYSLDEDVGPNAIEVAMHRLRKKLEPYGFKCRTIRGLGYMVEKQL